MAHDWQSIRSQYLHDPDQIYLNTGSWGVMPTPVYEDYVGLIRQLESNPTQGRRPLLERLAESRRALAGYLNIQARDLALLPNVTAALNMVVNGLDWAEGDEILTTDQEYGAILNTLDNASKRWGVPVVKAEIPVPPESPAAILAPIEAAITDQTRLLICSHITTRTGMILPIKEISELAHRHGVLVAYDGAHAPGMGPVDLAESDADFYGGNCHKWLCSPKGVGFLYANPSVQPLLHHLIVSWGYSPEGTVEVDGEPTINSSPAMWGLGNWGTVDLPGQVATGEAVRFQEEIGTEAIAARGRELSGYVRDRVSNLPWIDILSPSKPGLFGSITTIRLRGMGGKNLNKQLFETYRITIPVFEEGEDASVRVSTHLYNLPAEIDHLFKAITEIQSA